MRGPRKEHHLHRDRSYCTQNPVVQTLVQRCRGAARQGRN